MAYRLLHLGVRSETPAAFGQSLFPSLKQGGSMESRKVAARFVAFTCFLNFSADDPASIEEAGRLAREHWREFLPSSGKQLATFLTGKEPVSTMCRERRVKKSLVPNRELALAN